MQFRRYGGDKERVVGYAAVRVLRGRLMDALGSSAAVTGTIGHCSMAEHAAPEPAIDVPAALNGTGATFVTPDTAG